MGAKWGFAFVLPALIAGTAGTASAQDFRADSSSVGGGTRGGFGFEVLADLRELTLDSYEETYLGPPAPNTTPPPPATEWDEDLVEHRLQYHARHYGAFVNFAAAGEGSTPWRVGVRVGAVTATIREEVLPRAFLYGGLPFRFKLDIESKTGFGGGAFGDVRIPLQGQPVFLGLGFDGWLGQVSMDNGYIFDSAANLLDGEYFFALATVAGRIGVKTPQGVSPYVGFAGTYYYGDLELNAIPRPTGTGIDKHEAKFGSRSMARVLAGFQLGKGGEALARLEVGIWKPGNDLAVSAMAFVRI
ncbi:MAG: hypothetical protein L0216_15595 [Planctomycetales bacterium]|nr:hypothetical protein [Planctomycetales bacterium]